MNPELIRQNAQYAGKEDWALWGPYLAERQWATVREDYSPHGNAWEYFPHAHAHQRTYRWGEDGLAGFSDRDQRLCLSLALWNGRDPILKERVFGLTNSQGNHGEDVKDLYWYLDATPTHSYLKFLYKYPQAAFPYEQLVEENQRRGKDQPEFELVDTGVFGENRYFDVQVEYAKAGPDDILMLVTATNHGPEAAPLHLIPQLTARNVWSWNRGNFKKFEMGLEGEGRANIKTTKALGDYQLAFEAGGEAWFCENETNTRALYGSADEGYFKDGFHQRLVHGNTAAINPAQQGSKLGVHHALMIPAGQNRSIRVRLSRATHANAFKGFDSVMAQRRAEADAFYGQLQAHLVNDDAKLVQRQALAGMIWSKQYYYFDIPQWLEGDPGHPAPPAERKQGRNREWLHLNNAEIISMPDTWEYPWYAAWDLAFHCVPLALVDPEFAKQQLLLLTREWYMHPNGQMPAYEWAFGDVNPPVHAWATWLVYEADAKRSGKPDREFLERVFHKLMLNFTWWVNRKDAGGRNIFQGGFLGLDNIGVFDRSSPLPTGGYINQADGTSWMAMYSLNLMRIALELAQDNPVYEDIATKFFEHFLHIAEAMNNLGEAGVGLWDDADKFFYDVLSMPSGELVPLRLRSMVGLIPLFAVEVLDPGLLEKLPNFRRRLEWVMKYQPELKNLVSHWELPGMGERRLLGLLRGRRMKCVLSRMLDETEFLSDYGVRALSKIHEREPYVFEWNDQRFTVAYEPAESSSGLFGGNSNWRGPIWMPVNFMLIESIARFHDYYGDDFKVECPTGSGKFLNLKEVAAEIAHRLTRIFLADSAGKRPLYGHHPQTQSDPNFSKLVHFYEYFHGDTGRGVGANHQTGWTGLVAQLIHQYPPPDTAA
jgi:hypothetical protein